MIEATSCGGVVIYRGKILTLYKSYKHKYEGWVLPKGTVEKGEDYKDTALREVKEEAGVTANIIKYVGKSQYSFCVPEDTVEKDVYWYLMSANSYYSKPQREEYFVDSGFYKFHEAYHLLRFSPNPTYPKSFNLSPSITLVAIFAIGYPVDLPKNGTVLEERGFTSIM